MTFTDKEVDVLLFALMVTCATEPDRFTECNDLHTKILFNREKLTGKEAYAVFGICVP